MADRLEESVEIIRRDRDRSRDFLADVSHELRTPIAALRMFNELLQRDRRRRPDVAGRVPRVEPPAARAARLAGPEPARALEARLGARPARPAARTTSGRPSSRPSSRPRPTARDAALTLRLSLPREPGPDPPRPAADRPGRHQPRRQRAQVHAARRRRSSVELRPDRGRGADRSFATRASGSTPAELPRIFERFYRGTMANEARGSGSGLGLAIVKSIVDMHGGPGHRRQPARRRARPSR